MKHWTEQLFIDASDLFMLDLEAGIERAKLDCQGIQRILESNGVVEGSRLLDVPCGIGRHSVELAAMGYSVVGVDFSEPFLRRARSRADEKGVAKQCTFINRDMRELASVLKEDKFDAALNLFTSIGYYDEKTDVKVFKQMRQLTRRDGCLIVETFNRDWMVRNFRPVDVIDKGEEIIYKETRRFNLETSRMESEHTYYTRQGDDLVHLKTVNSDHRVYSMHEIRNMLKKAGWAPNAFYGAFDQRPASWDTNRIIAVAVNTKGPQPDL
jgi:ubiquinone/menaquinone biosynthesis C-methylase UbiE